jgi:hypothetical protein
LKKLREKTCYAIIFQSLTNPPPIPAQPIPNLVLYERGQQNNPGEREQLTVRAGSRLKRRRCEREESQQIVTNSNQLVIVNS